MSGEHDSGGRSQELDRRVPANEKISDDRLKEVFGDKGEFLGQLSDRLSLLSSSSKGTEMLVRMLNAGERERNPQAVVNMILGEADDEIARIKRTNPTAADRKDFAALVEADEQSLPALLHERQSKKQEVTRVVQDHPDRPPSLHHLPSPVYTARLETLEEIIPRWGADGKEILAKAKEATTGEIFSDIVAILDAAIKDTEQRDAHFQDDPRTRLLDAEKTAGFEALTDPKTPHVQINAETGNPVVPVTPQNGEEPKATAGRKDGMYYVDMSRGRNIIAGDFLGILQTDVRVLNRAKEAAESYSTGEPLAYDPDELFNPGEDPRVMSLDQWLRESTNACIRAEMEVKKTVEAEEDEHKKSELEAKIPGILSVRAFLEEAHYRLTEETENPTGVPDRPAEIIPPDDAELLGAITNVLKRTDGDPEAATLEDLAAILRAEENDVKTLKDNINMLEPGIKAAKGLLGDSGDASSKVRKVNVSLEQDDNGTWKAAPWAEKSDREDGKLYFTLTRSRIVDLELEIANYYDAVDFLETARAAAEIKAKGQPLAENDPRSKALEKYIENKMAQLEERAKTLPDDPETQSYMEKYVALFDSFYEQQYTYTPQQGS